MDVVDSATRSRMMAGIAAKNTKGELVLRRGLHARGLRFRVNVKSLPGTPDLALRRYSSVLFFNGCFWHQHDCALFRWPKTRAQFWKTKLSQNRERDERVWAELSSDGWRLGVVWECALKALQGDTHELLLDDIDAWIRQEPRQSIAPVLATGNRDRAAWAMSVTDPLRRPSGQTGAATPLPTINKQA